MAKREMLTENQVTEVREFMQSLYRNDWSIEEIAKMFDRSPSHTNSARLGHQRPGPHYWDVYQRIRQTDSEPEPQLERSNPEPEPDIPHGPCAVEVLDRVEALLREAREALLTARKGSTFRPLLAPGVKALLERLDHAHQLLEHPE